MRPRRAHWLWHVQVLKLQRQAAAAGDAAAAGSCSESRVPPASGLNSAGKRDKLAGGLQAVIQLPALQIRRPSWRRLKAAERLKNLPAAGAVAVDGSEDASAQVSTGVVSATFQQWGQSAAGGPSTVSGPLLLWAPPPLAASRGKSQAAGQQCGYNGSGSDESAEAGHGSEEQRRLPGLYLLGKPPPAGWSCPPMEDWSFGSSDDLVTMDTASHRAAFPSAEVSAISLAPPQVAQQAGMPEGVGVLPEQAAQGARARGLAAVAAARVGGALPSAAGRRSSNSPAVAHNPACRRPAGFRTAATMTISCRSFMYSTRINRGDGLSTLGEPDCVGHAGALAGFIGL